MRLSPIKQVSLNKLKPNEANTQYFKAEGRKYFNELLEDVKKRGIQVPLIAKKDGTLLAGHNRLLVAQTLELEAVPVQYVIEDLSHEEEIDYIIKDNLLRRHLSHEEREELYRRLYKDFDQRVMIKGVRGVGVTAEEVVEKTGLNVKTVSRDLTMIRRRKQKEIREVSGQLPLDEKAIYSYKKATAHMLNVVILHQGDIADVFLEIMKDAEARLLTIKQNLKVVGSR